MSSVTSIPGVGDSNEIAFSRRRTVSVGALLAAITLVVYFPAFHFPFISYDDPGYILHNPRIHGGLSVENFIWAFQTYYCSNWHPLTWLIHFATFQCFGLKSGAFHAVNIVMHTASGVLLLLLLQRITGHLGRSAMVAGLFLLHPIHVESAAWVSELKDVSCVFFMLVTMHAHLSYVRSPTVRRYALILGCYALALLAKPMAVTLPFVLLLLDCWPLGRVFVVPTPGLRYSEGPDSAPSDPGLRGTSDPASVRRMNLTRIIVEKIPLFLMAAGDSFMTSLAQRAAMEPIDVLPLSVRLLNAICAYGRYIAKLFLPVDLAVFYPQPSLIGRSQTHWLIASVVMLGIFTLIAVKTRKSRPYLLVGWLWFLGTLVPVIGLLQVGEQSMADRYSYFPSIGLSIAVIWLVADWLGSYRGLSVAAGVAVLAICTGLTSVQVAYWQDSQTLFSHAMAVTDRNYIAMDHLANDAIERGHPEIAISLAQKAIEINRKSPYAYIALGRAYAEIKEPREALEADLDALKLSPNDAELHNNTATNMVAVGDLRGAAVEYQRAIGIDPQFVSAYCNLGYVLAALGDLHGAEYAWNHALEIDPQNAAARKGLMALNYGPDSPR
jgi:protein O-mannosyl-transferase